MGLRSTIKDRLKTALGRQAGPTSGATAPAGAMPTTSATPPASSAASPRPAVSPRPAAASPGASPAASPAGATAAADEAEKQAKIQKHQAKTKAGMLKWLGEQEGGASHMGPMHDHCEKRFFVAHRGFSNLMEELTGQGLVTYDAETGMVVITSLGRAWKG